jgi:hypothetical protein
LLEKWRKQEWTKRSKTIWENTYNRKNNALINGVCILYPLAYCLTVIKILNTDKKNENKEVAVNDFLPATAAYEAIQHSM